MKRRFFMGMSLLVTSLLLGTACGAEKAEDNGETLQSAQESQGQFAVSELTESFRLKPAAYKALAAGKPEDVQYTVTPYSAVCDGSFYVLRQFFTDSGYQCVVDSYTAPEFERTEVSLPLTEWEAGELRIAGFDVCEEGMHFLLASDTGSCLVVNTDKSGALTKKIQPEAEYPDSSFYAFRCSGEAFFFIKSSVTDGTQECIRLDAQGKVCGSFSCDGEKMIGLPAKGEEGSLFFR